MRDGIAQYSDVAVFFGIEIRRQHSCRTGDWAAGLVGAAHYRDKVTAHGTGCGLLEGGLCGARWNRAIL